MDRLDDDYRAVLKLTILGFSVAPRDAWMLNILAGRHVDAVPTAELQRIVDRLEAEAEAHV